MSNKEVYEANETKRIEEALPLITKDLEEVAKKHNIVLSMELNVTNRGIIAVLVPRMLVFKEEAVA